MSRTTLTRRAVMIGAIAMAFPARAETWVAFNDHLVALVPPGFHAEIRDDALHVTQTEAVRNPLTMTLRVTADFRLHRRWFPNRRGDIRYTIQNLGGSGSGGPVHELRAVRNAQAPLALIAQRQAESRPDFEIALDLLSSVRRPPG
ncbi:hypothetical protein A8B78_01665 [Jannaschia sp. EhC01]|nr:hypothetical protein A8B78_01665 [Jannaschia sp. EhC01]